MKTLLFLKPVAAVLALAAGASAMAQSATAGISPAPADRAAIEKTMFAYEAALNASSTERVMPLYTDDGVFMPPGSPSAVGSAALKAAYVNVFKAITLRVKFKLAEIVAMSPEWAFVRTTSAGTQTVHATGAQTAEANQELFLLKKGTDGAWRIARYSFSGTNPRK